MFAVPVALAIGLPVHRVEQDNRGAGFVHDKVRQAPLQVCVERVAEYSLQTDVRRLHAASTTQRKPTQPERSLPGDISRYLPCWSRRYACGKYQCEVCG